MEMYQVRYFLAAARLLNFTRAALECNVSQPSLTKAVIKLEEEFGGALFRRERSRTHLTELGKAMLPHLQQSFDAAQAAKLLAVNIGRAQVAPLALGIVRTAENAALGSVLAELGTNLCGFELAITSGTNPELIELALSGALDLAILEMPDELPERLQLWPLFAHDYCIAVSSEHPLAAKTDVAVAELESECWIDFAGDGCASLARLAEPAGVAIAVRHQAQTLVQLRQMVNAMLGCAWLPGTLIEGSLAPVPVAGLNYSPQVALAAISGRKRSVAAEAFVRAARAQAWQVSPLPG